ncbi:MAG TPA: hypothetical protein DCE39_01430, partial [Planctomycetaceae bacterium]|nr:hypothetical protein [Planctomycetaceae bacterium]
MNPGGTPWTLHLQTANHKDLHVRRIPGLLLIFGWCLTAIPPGGIGWTAEPTDSAPTISVQQPSVDDWSQFRGPGGQGHSIAEELPLNWSESKNVTWKSAIEGTGWSSPVTRGKQIWLTTAVDQGKSLLVICLDRATGRQLHRIAIFASQMTRGLHPKNSHASPT